MRKAPRNMEKGYFKIGNTVKQRVASHNLKRTEGQMRRKKGCEKGHCTKVGRKTTAAGAAAWMRGGK